MTVPEAAEQLRLSSRSIWQAISKGKLKAIRFGKRATRVPVEELERFIQEAASRTAG